MIPNNEVIDKFPRGVAVIDMSLVKNNVECIKKQAGDNKLFCVIKANAYGHGAIEFAKLYESMDEVYGFAVATSDEALSLINNHIKKPILIIGYTFESSYNDIIKNNIRTAVFRYDQIDQLDKIAGEIGNKAIVHLKTDTGMGRIGIFPDEEGLKFVKYCLSKKNIVVEGIFSHMAKADEKNLSYANMQLSRFDSFIKMIERECNYIIPIKHIANSASILQVNEALKYDACRAGIILYGLVPSNDVSVEPFGIKPVLSLYSHITYVKRIKKGESISYGGIYTCDSDRTVATVPLGYADGYPRSLTKKGFVLVNGKKAPIIGKICMDQFMIDVTDIENVNDGDLVTLIGTDKDETISLDYISDLSGRFNYEFACLLTDRIKRVYVY